MTTSYFTFGFEHKKRLDGIDFDSTWIIKITADEPRKVMTSYFGNNWSTEYDSLPDTKFFRGGIYEVLKNRRVGL